MTSVHNTQHKEQFAVSIRIKLLSAVFVCTVSFTVFAVVAWNTLSVTKINGENYRKIALKQELVADILPPPEYLVEAYLVLFQMLEEKDQAALKDLLDKSRSLRVDYEKRHEYWLKNLESGSLKDELVVKSYQPGIKFLDVLDKEIIPAVLNGNHQAARDKINTVLKPLYDEHRKAIDNVVSEAGKRLQDEEIGAAALIRQRTMVLLVLAAIGMVALLFCGVYVNHISSVIIGRIGRVVAGLSLSVNHVLSSAGQLTVSSQQLAEGASEQAAAVEETSSSLNEMASMTKQNADNANEANRLMKETRNSVKGASRTMEKLTASMTEISQASQETSKIIRTIDEIAFQTNLLALNAAVEAARAGEAGAGFSVVAEEVRNLAMRTAEAAKSTANLIEGNIKRIGEGSELVEKTDSEFRDMAADVGRSGELIGEISAASQEQALGIEQVNKAMGEMDKIVQQNAASAEESATSSEEMSAQAGHLKEFVDELIAIVGGAGVRRDTGNGLYSAVGKRRLPGSSSTEIE